MCLFDQRRVSGGIYICRQRWRRVGGGADTCRRQWRRIGNGADVCRRRYRRVSAGADECGDAADATRLAPTFVGNFYAGATQVDEKCITAFESTRPEATASKFHAEEIGG